ncbi:unnamed protein product [Alternaria alternata]
MPSLQLLARRNRTISWVDQFPTRPAPSPSPSSEVNFGGAQTTHGSEIAPLFAQEDSDSDPSSSTLSLNSPFSSDLHLAIQSLTPQTTITDQQSEITMLTSPRDLSPFKGKPLWEPDDEEWEGIDAIHISSTYKASFRDPRRCSPQKTTNASTLSRFSSTITSFLPFSPAKLAAEARLRDEEELRDKLEELGNTYYSDPAGDVHDTAVASTFLSGSRYFRHDQTGSFARAPHVIDLERYFNTQDPLAGSYRNLGFSLSWTLYVRAAFNATGLWYETFASPVAGSSPIVNGVPAWDTFIPINASFSFPVSSPFLPPPSSCQSQQSTVPLESSPRKILLASPTSPPQWTQGMKKDNEEENNTINPTDEKFVLYQSRVLARFFLRDIWIRFEGRYECKATWEVDGAVSEVRLRRAVVGFPQDNDDDG